MFPTVSICVPTYNRKRFEQLLEYNINCQTYRNIVEVLICDDGDDEPFNLDVLYPVEIVKSKARLSIGAKRNILAKKARGEFIAHMDDDDIYFPSYIDYSVMMMLQDKKDVAGTGDMLFVFPDFGWKQCALHCPDLHMANEATMVYRKSFWEGGRFSNDNISEGQHFLKGREKQIFRSNIGLVMICIAHGKNTVDKMKWLSQPFDEMPNYYHHKKLLKAIGLGNVVNDDLMHLADNTRTDKNTVHSYLPLYQSLLAGKRESAKNVLEVGIWNGGSIKMWSDFFKNATVYALDIIDDVWNELKNKPNIVLHISTDAYNEDFFVSNFLDKNIKCDFMLDDGPHTLESMKQFIKLYSQIMTDDGILIIEDVQEWDWIELLKNAVPDDLKPFIKVYDLRPNKNRYDDIVFTIDKSNLTTKHAVPHQTDVKV